MFNNAFSVRDHINNNIDTSVHPEERYNIIQGNIGALVAGHSRLHYTVSENPSVLGIAGNTRRPEKLITSDGTATSISGRSMSVSSSFYGDESPLLTGESGFGIDWNVLNNPQNNIGYSLDFSSNRSLGFPFYATSGDNIKAIPSSPPIELVEKNGRVVPSWESIPKALPGLGTPVGDWTKYSNFHHSGLNKM